MKKAALGVKPPKLHEKPLITPEQVIEGVSEYVDLPITKTKTQPLLIGIAPMTRKIQTVVGYRHVPLRWATPGPDGKLTPKK